MTLFRLALDIFDNPGRELLALMDTVLHCGRDHDVFEAILPPHQPLHWTP